MAGRAGVTANQPCASFPSANQRQERTWGREAGAAVRLKSGELRAAAGRLEGSRRPAGLGDGRRRRGLVVSGALAPRLRRGPR